GANGAAAWGSGDDGEEGSAVCPLPPVGGGGGLGGWGGGPALTRYGAVVRSGGALEEGLAPEELREALRDPGARAWLDLESASPEEIAAVGGGLAFPPWPGGAPRTPTRGRPTRRTAGSCSSSPAGASTNPGGPGWARLRGSS